MKRRTVISAGMMLAALTAAGCASMQGGEWVTLIDGEKGLENFNEVGSANWRAEGGAIVADKGKGSYLVSKNAYKDIEVYAEFWADHITNSGLHIRCQDPNKITDRTCYEANIFDQRADQTYGTGGIVHRGSVPVPNPHKAGGKWNVYEFYAKGPELTVKLNGVVTTSIVNTELASAGRIALQFGNRGKEPGGAIKWRKVQVRTL